MVPGRVVAHVLLQQLLDIWQLGVPEVEAADEPLSCLRISYCRGYESGEEQVEKR